MTRMNIVLGAAALVFAAGCYLLFTEVNAERDRVAALEAQVAQLQREITAQREFNTMLDRQRERARIELEKFRTHARATERNRSTSR